MLLNKLTNRTKRSLRKVNEVKMWLADACRFLTIRDNPVALPRLRLKTTLYLLPKDALYALIPKISSRPTPRTWMILVKPIYSVITPQLNSPKPRLNYPCPKPSLTNPLTKLFTLVARIAKLAAIITAGNLRSQKPPARRKSSLRRKRVGMWRHLLLDLKRKDSLEKLI